MSGGNQFVVSYNSADQEVVEAIERFLAARIGQDCLGRCNLSWPQELDRVRGVVVFIGRAGLDRRQKREMALALARQAQAEQAGDIFSVIPVLLPGADLAPAFLFSNCWVDLRSDPADPQTVAELARAIRETVPRRPVAVIADLCPYRGLLPFREEDAAFFFGREEAAGRLFEALQERDLIVLIGPTGSGKTSLVQAGLWPRLRRQQRPDTTWEMVLVAPGNRPFYRLAAALLPFLEPDMAETKRPAAIRRLGYRLANRQTCLEDSVADALRQSPQAGRFLLVVDQFEALFSLVSAGERRSFVRTLLQALERAPLSLLLILRAEFCDQAIALSPELSPYLEQSAFHLEPMSRQELKRAMVSPTRPLTLAFEPGLAQRILDDAGRLSASLPLLQFTLAELWRQHQGGLLGQAAYDRMGQLAGAITYRAETILDTLRPKQRQLVYGLFSRLVHVDVASEVVCRPVTLAELSASLVPGEAEQILDILRSLAEAHLLRMESDPASDDVIVELASPVIIHHWSRLYRWVNTQREFLLWRHRTQPALARWEQLARSEEALLPAAALAEAGWWLAERPGRLESTERAYIYQSLACQDRQRDMKWLTGLVISAAVVVIVALVVLHTIMQRHLALVGQTQPAAGQRVAAAARSIAETGWPGAEIAKESIKIYEINFTRSDQSYGRDRPDYQSANVEPDCRNSEPGGGRQERPEYDPGPAGGTDGTGNWLDLFERPDCPGSLGRPGLRPGRPPQPAPGPGFR